MAISQLLYFLYLEAQLGRRNGTECVPVCVCFCTLMSCLFIAGDSPSSLAASQDLFFPSLYITVNNITETVCPVLFLTLLPPPPSRFVSLMVPVLSQSTVLHVKKFLGQPIRFVVCSWAAVTPMGLWYEWSGTDALWSHPNHSVVWWRGMEKCVGREPVFYWNAPYFLTAQDLLPVTPYAYRTLPSWTLGHVQLKYGFTITVLTVLVNRLLLSPNRTLWRRGREWYQRGGDQREVKKIEPQRIKKSKKNWKKLLQNCRNDRENEGQAPFLHL